MRSVLPNDTSLPMGDGISVVSSVGPARATITRTLVDTTARAGLSSFGAILTLDGSAVRCAAIPLTGQGIGAFDYAFEDRGGNVCGCPVADGSCKLVDAALVAPEPPPPL